IQWRIREGGVGVETPLHPIPIGPEFRSLVRVAGVGFVYGVGVLNRSSPALGGIGPATAAHPRAASRQTPCSTLSTKPTAKSLFNVSWPDDAGTPAPSKIAPV